jgi:hypothetical protein
MIEIDEIATGATEVLVNLRSNPKRPITDPMNIGLLSYACADGTAEQLRPGFIGRAESGCKNRLGVLRQPRKSQPGFLPANFTSFATVYRLCLILASFSGHRRDHAAINFDNYAGDAILTRNLQVQAVLLGGENLLRMALGNRLSRTNRDANAMMLLKLLRNSPKGNICAKVGNRPL